MIGQVAQMGFDFMSIDSQSFDLEHGAWLNPHWDAQEWVRAIDQATRRVPTVADQFRSLYQSAVDVAKVELAKVIEAGADVYYRLPSIKLASEGEALEAFVNACERLAKAPVGGIEVKVREDVRIKTAAVYIENVGTIIAYQWPQVGGGNVSYYPWKDSFFLPSYLDGMPIVKAPYSTWKGAYCADKLAMSGKGVASVPTFKLAGREYIQTGGMGVRGFEQARAWRICPISDWHGETHTYQSICKAYDDGIRERGDERGVVVKVRGQLCVLEAAMTVYDDQPAAETVARIFADRDAEAEEDAVADDDWLVDSEMEELAAEPA